MISPWPRAACGRRCRGRRTGLVREAVAVETLDGARDHDEVGHVAFDAPRAPGHTPNTSSPGDSSDPPAG
jgi:hypothetical protein